MFARGLFNYPTMGWRHPFAEWERVSRQMDRLTQGLLGRPGLGWRPASVFPAINLTEDTDHYYVRAELPGIKADALIPSDIAVPQSSPISLGSGVG